MRQLIAPSCLLLASACSPSDSGPTAEKSSNAAVAAQQTVAPTSEASATDEHAFALRCIGGVANSTLVSDFSAPPESQFRQLTLDFEINPATKQVRSIEADGAEDVCSACEVVIDRHQIMWTIDGNKTEDGINYRLSSSHHIDRRSGALTLSYKMVAGKGDKTVTIQSQGVLRCEKVADAASLPRSF